MAYCTQQDMIDRFGLDEIVQLTDLVDSGLVDADRLNQAIERGASLIDSYCRGSYQIPLSPVDAIIIDINADLARYHLYDDQATEQVAKNHAEAILLLKQIAQQTLYLSAAAITGSASRGAPKFDDDGRVFGRSNTRDY